jgi:DNA modification methylase
MHDPESPLPTAAPSTQGSLPAEVTPANPAPSDLESHLGRVTHGDCIERMLALPEGSVHLAFADPPFNIGYEYDVYDDRLERSQYLEWSRRWISAVHRATTPSGAFWLAIGDEYAAELKIIAQDIGFHCRSWVIWYYTFGVHCRLKFTRSHAHIFHFVKDPKSFLFRADEVSVPSARQLVYADARANPKGRTPDDTWILRPQDCREGLTPNEDTWYFPRVAGTFKERAGFHGCQMPEQLLARILRVSSEPEGIVMDPFSGSASTLVVAKKLGRRFLGFDLSEEYVQLGNQRLERVAVGDGLDGAPDPKHSAPSTKDGKTRNAEAKPKAGGARKRGSNSDSHAAALPLFDTPLSEPQAILEAFHQSHNGFSVERVIVDPHINERFQLGCDALQVLGNHADRNRLLLRLRSRGMMADAPIDFEQRTALEWTEVDRFAFASEIAWRRLTDLYLLDLDHLLCDPRLAQHFDRIASDHAPGRSPLEYRWTALLIRRALQSSAATMKQMQEARVGNFWEGCPHAALDSKQVESLPEEPCVYAIGKPDQSATFYVGATQNMRERLRWHCQEGWLTRLPEGPHRQAEIRWRVTPWQPSQAWAQRTLWVDATRPVWNVLPDPE